MTNQELDRANALKYEIKRMDEIMDVLRADDLVISIMGTVGGIKRAHEWSGNDGVKLELQDIFGRTIADKICRYIAEFESL